MPRRPEERTPAAMANLAVLPLFHDLKGRRVVIWGATDAAGWKSDLVAAAGAVVVRITDDRLWDADDLAGAALTIADAAGDDQAEGTGRVTLVGAGPGDAELLTLKAVRALQSADVILYDDLVSDDVLELARREAKRLLVGKRGNRPSCRQDEINDLMIKLAGQGKQVVRLKSGDPMIFGRAGEEIAELKARGIAVDVVPGITAALGAAAALGVSLTHRDHARSVRFVTGHGQAGGLPDDLDWRGLADPGTTLMVYMGGRTAGILARRLIEQGRAPGTPAVIVANVSRADETRDMRTLGYLAGQTPDVGEGPVLIGVGEVFAGLRQVVPIAEPTVAAAPPVSVAPTNIKA